jgi:hypothetical protein
MGAEGFLACEASRCLLAAAEDRLRHGPPRCSLSLKLPQFSGGFEGANRPRPTSLMPSALDSCFCNKAAYDPFRKKELAAIVHHMFGIFHGAVLIGRAGGPHRGGSRRRDIVVAGKSGTVPTDANASETLDDVKRQRDRARATYHYHHAMKSCRRARNVAARCNPGKLRW